MTGNGQKPIRAPTVVRAYDYTSTEAAGLATPAEKPIIPNTLIKPEAHAMLKALLSAPLCHRVGTAARRPKAWRPAATEGRQVFVDAGAQLDVIE